MFLTFGPNRMGGGNALGYSPPPSSFGSTSGLSQFPVNTSLASESDVVIDINNGDVSGGGSVSLGPLDVNFKFGGGQNGNKQTTTTTTTTPTTTPSNPLSDKAPLYLGLGVLALGLFRGLK